MKRYAFIISFISCGYILGWTSCVLRFGLASFGGHEGSHKSRGADGMFEDLGLSQSQKESIQKIREEEKVQQQALKRQIENMRQEFENLLGSSNDIHLLEVAFSRMIDSKYALEKSHFAHMMKVHQILTLEQIQELGKRHLHKGPRDPHRGGPPSDFDGPPPPPWDGGDGRHGNFPPGPPP